MSVADMLAAARGEKSGGAAPAAKASQAKNFVAIGTWLGWHQNAFFPKQAGQDYEMPVTLSPLSELRDEFTIFSGLDHRSPNGHGAWSNFLCGSKPGDYSLDQFVADVSTDTMGKAMNRIIARNDGQMKRANVPCGMGQPCQFGARPSNRAPIGFY